MSAECHHWPNWVGSGIAWAIKNMANGKAPGSDGVTAELLREAGDSVVEFMHKICTEVWLTRNGWSQYSYYLFQRKVTR